MKYPLDEALLNSLRELTTRQKRRVTFGLFNYKTKQVDFTEFGYFHAWGLDVDESESGLASFSAAIVEMEDGTVRLIRATNVKFLD